MSKRPFLFCFFLLPVLLLTSNLPFQPKERPAPPATYTPKQAKEDLQALRQAFEKLHPALYRYTTREEMDRLFDSVSFAMTKDMGERELYAALKLMVSKVRDGHTGLRPSESFKKFLDNEARVFPLHVKYIQDTAYILTGDKIPRGSRITAINGESMKAITEKLLWLIPSDGYITTKKYMMLSEDFSFYHYLQYGTLPNFEVEYVTAKGDAGKMRLEPVTFNIYNTGSSGSPASMDWSKLSHHSPELSLHFPAKGVAYLDINTFDHDMLKQRGFDFPAFLDSVFRTIKNSGADKLIIDLRDNGGGRDLYGSLLYAYIEDEPFTYYGSLEARSQDINYDLTRTGTSSYNNLSPALLDSAEGGRFTLKPEAHENLGTIYPKPNRFDGKVYILIDGRTFSTAAEFAAIAYSRRRATFIGEETGGACNGSSAIPFTIPLPHSKTKVIVPTIQYNMDVTPRCKPGRGIIPDHPQHLSIQNILDDRDTQYLYALDLANRNQ